MVAHENVAGEVILGKSGPASEECVLIGFVGLRVVPCWESGTGTRVLCTRETQCVYQMSRQFLGKLNVNHKGLRISPGSLVEPLSRTPGILDPEFEWQPTEPVMRSSPLPASVHAAPYCCTHMQ